MYVDRSIKELFWKITHHYNLIALVGPRQAGKTTFLKQQINEVPSSSYLLFDDPDIRTLFEEDIKKFEFQYIEGQEPAILDEVHYCKDAGMKLKYLVDTSRRLWISSSSELILGTDVLSYLVGRVSVLRLYPFSLREFLSAKGQKVQTTAIMERMVWEHMSFGGYPKVVLTKEPEMKRILLRDLYETMLLKDVARSFSITDIRALETCARYLALGVGGVLSYDGVSNSLNISFRTLKKYLDAMEKSYLTFTVRPYFTNKQKEITKQPKVYFLDTGIRNMITKRFDSQPEGSLFENYVLSELVKMGFSPRYWRTKAKAEVDFVIEKEGKVVPIEVKLQAVPGKIGRSLRSFINSYEPEQAVVVVYKGKTGEMKLGGCRIRFVDVMGLWENLKAD